MLSRHETKSSDKNCEAWGPRPTHFPILQGRKEDGPAEIAQWRGISRHPWCQARRQLPGTPVLIPRVCDHVAFADEMTSATSVPLYLKDAGSPETESGARLEVEQPRLQLAPTGHAGVTGSGLFHRAPILAFDSRLSPATGGYHSL